MRERALKIGLVLLGLLFVAAIYPLITMLRQDPVMSMMASLYVTLGVFLLLALGNPAAHRSLIAFTAWSSFAHAAVMLVQYYEKAIAPRELIGVVMLVVIGVVLVALVPAKQSVAQVSEPAHAHS